MTKNKYRIFLLICLIVVCTLLYFASDAEFKKLYSSESVLAVSDENKDYKVRPSGEPIGIYVKTDGVMVIDTSEIENGNGKRVSPCSKVLKQGDYIVSINGTPINDKNDLIGMVEKSDGKELSLGIVRDEENLSVKVCPALNEEGRYMLGLWVKDDISGIGTLTFVDDKSFGALGHSINDNDTGAVFSISDGAIYGTNLINIVKTDGSNPGRLEGMIDYSSKNLLGRVEKNDMFGISGFITQKGEKKLKSQDLMEVCSKQEAHTGRAYLLSAITGEPTYYEVQITSIDTAGDSDNKGIEIKVTDSRLLAITGGIVQGMSGTPIIQDGKLLGAVTHVFLKDSTKGYGAFVCDMIEKND